MGFEEEPAAAFSPGWECWCRRDMISRWIDARGAGSGSGERGLSCYEDAYCRDTGDLCLRRLGDRSANRCIPEAPQGVESAKKISLIADRSKAGMSILPRGVHHQEHMQRAEGCSMSEANVYQLVRVRCSLSRARAVGKRVPVLHETVIIGSCETLDSLADFTPAYYPTKCLLILLLLPHRRPLSLVYPGAPTFPLLSPRRPRLSHGPT